LTKIEKFGYITKSPSYQNRQMDSRQEGKASSRFQIDEDPLERQGQTTCEGGTESHGSRHRWDGRVTEKVARLF